MARFVLAGASFAASACTPPYDDVLVNAQGQQIRLTTIHRIVDDPDLDEDQQRRALMDLGITDEELIDSLIRTAG